MAEARGHMAGGMEPWQLQPEHAVHGHMKTMTFTLSPKPKTGLLLRNLSSAPMGVDMRYKYGFLIMVSEVINGNPFPDPWGDLESKTPVRVPRNYLPNSSIGYHNRGSTF